MSLNKIISTAILSGMVSVPSYSPMALQYQAQVRRPDEINALRRHEPLAIFRREDYNFRLEECDHPEGGGLSGPKRRRGRNSCEPYQRRPYLADSPAGWL